MSELITCDRARVILAAQHFDWGEEMLALPRVQGRVLAEPLTADRDQPPFDRVAMDGITFNFTSYASGQRVFRKERTQAAGDVPTPLSDPKNCIEIMTGAAVPQGCTAVVRYEDLEEETDGFRVPDGMVDRQNIHSQGKDAKAGQELAPAGTRIGVAAVGMLATCGYAKVKVRKLPRITIVATGDELVDVEVQPAPHQIRKSNLYQLRALLEKHGFTAKAMHLPDDRKTLSGELGKLLNTNDIIMLSGGVSKGKFDYIPGVLTDLGVKKMFHGVAQRPGKPLWTGRTTKTMVFGLPGNPQSSLSCCLAYVLPFLNSQVFDKVIDTYAVLRVPVDFKPNLSLFAYVELTSDPQSGKLLATPVKHAGSGDSSSLLRGNGFLELPAGRDRYEAGEVFQVRRI